MMPNESLYLELALHRHRFAKIMEELERSSVIILDVSQIPEDALPCEDIRNCENPSSSYKRQKFNERLLAARGDRYLIGRYLEDRSEMLKGTKIAEEGRTLHLGIDLFSVGLEPVYSPFDGQVVRVGYEAPPAGYGHYVIVGHLTEGIRWYSLFAHLSNNFLPQAESYVVSGRRIGFLGDHDENGGWSRHLHYQILRELPPEEQTPIGYTDRKGMDKNKRLFPDPRLVTGNIYHDFLLSVPDPNKES